MTGNRANGAYGPQLPSSFGDAKRATRSSPRDQSPQTHTACRAWAAGRARVARRSHNLLATRARAFVRHEPPIDLLSSRSGGCRRAPFLLRNDTTRPRSSVVACLRDDPALETGVCLVDHVCTEHRCARGDTPQGDRAKPARDRRVAATNRARAGPPPIAFRTLLRGTGQLCSAPGAHRVRRTPPLGAGSAVAEATGMTGQPTSPVRAPDLGPARVPASWRAAPLVFCRLWSTGR